MAKKKTGKKGAKRGRTPVPDKKKRKALQVYVTPELEQALEEDRTEREKQLQQTLGISDWSCSQNCALILHEYIQTKKETK